jgi:hypothetical protein
MDLNTFKEYIRLHTISLEQDLEAIENTGRQLQTAHWASQRISLQGAIDVSKHYLEILANE